MKTALIAVSAAGAALAETLHGIIRELWEAYKGLVFLCASGIAVRAIAPYISSKYTDPVATELGAIRLPGIAPRIGRLDSLAMTDLIEKERPALVLDATHPYAAEVSANIRAACTEAGVALVRILRGEGEAAKDCLSFSNHGDLIAWLEKTSGVIFVTTGAKEAAVFTGLSGFQERVWFRMLPDIGGLKNCLDLGYSAARIICMQGPFSRDLNRAMFAAAAASILVTKNSGVPGGFAEKLEAARDLGMRVALLARPPDPGGVPLERAIAELEGLGS